MDAKQYKEFVKRNRSKKSRNKYNAIRQTYNGRSYHSKMEARYAYSLDLRLKAGEFKSWTPQYKVELRGENGGLVATYKLDFMIEHHDGVIELVEVKGFATAAWRLKWNLLEDKFGKDARFKLTLVKQF